MRIAARAHGAGAAPIGARVFGVPGVPISSVPGAPVFIRSALPAPIDSTAIIRPPFASVSPGFVPITPQVGTTASAPVTVNAVAPPFKTVAAQPTTGGQIIIIRGSSF